MKKIYIITILFLLAIYTNATPLDSAKTLFNEGKYQEALPIFNEQLAQKPKDASLNKYAGMCLFHLNKYTEAQPFLQSANSNGIAECAKYLAIIAMKEYRFNDADKYLSNYKSSLSKSGAEIPTEVEKLSSQIMNARNMLERVEQIQIIDSINVDSKTFFNFYKLSNDVGSLNAPSILPSNFAAAQHTVVFSPESKTKMYWAMSDSTNNSFIVSSSILSDGIWEAPLKLGDALNDGGNANYPYIMPDGVTIYFANDGANSIGGYDIFISRYDEDGYLQPLNLGMPYNSPSNDYMLVIDENTGIGWWATDRNNIEEKITIYMFIPSDTRVNYPSDSPNIVNLAKINAIKDTWLENANYNELLDKLNNIASPNNSLSTTQFTLNLSNGKIYHNISDFKNSEAAVAMQEYLDALDKLNNNKHTLNSLRLKYSQGDKSVANQVLSLEKQILKEQEELIRLQNIAISLEVK